jgi:HD superfamily phosphodiesterase
MHIYPSELLFLEIAALLHDILDHKYCYPELQTEKSYDEKRKDMEEFLGYVNIPKHWIKRIIIWISNISYSQEIKYGYPEIPKEDIRFRNILSDADKLESLGDNGILRCIEYYRFKNPIYNEAELKKHVKEFVETRLLTLNNYFRTPLGKSISLKLIERTKEIYKFYE